MTWQTGTIRKVHLVRLSNGEDLLRGLEEFAKEAEIEHASILCGVGSIRTYHTHVVRTTNLPPGNDFVRAEGAYDILNVTGGILGGRVHAHIDYSDLHVAHGGHLEEGTEVLTFAFITVAELDGIDLTDMDHYLV